jgi:hypothetical protein
MALVVGALYSIQRVQLAALVQRVSAAFDVAF